jgi:hypothetical protein
MWLYGQKSNTRRIAQTLWQITQVKTVSFTIQEKFEFGVAYE